MKGVTSLLAAALLLALTSAVAAEAPPSGSTIVPAPATQAAEPTTDEALLGLGGECELDGDSLILTGIEGATPAVVQYCGSCSEPICRGAIRGSSCGTAGSGKHCNIFSGGYMCPTGGWECQCQAGDLP
jgi:hypothetical protein